MPPDIPASRTFWYTGLGCFIGATLIMAFGACLASLEPTLAKDPANAVANLFGSGRTVARLLIIVGVVQGNVMNLYSAYMSVTTIFSGIRGAVRTPKSHKLLIMALLMVAATALALLAQGNFQGYFADMLDALIYFLVPWSAINLADYYLVRKGNYDIADMFRIDGRYGAFRWPTLGVYVLGVAVQIPFMSLSFFKGSIAQWLGADLAWIPGLLVPGILHTLFAPRTRHGLQSVTLGSPLEGNEVERK